MMPLTRIVYLVLLWCAAAVSMQLNIGGLFLKESSSGNANQLQIEHQAAFLQAIREINNKSDGILDDILPNIELKFVVRDANNLELCFSGSNSIVHSFGGNSVVGVINSLSDDLSLISDALFAEAKVPQLLSVATSSHYNDYKLHPYSVRTVAPESFQGMVLQSLLCSYFNVRKIVVVSTTDFDGKELSQELLDHTYCNKFTVLADIRIRAETIDFTSQIQEIKASGARYFVLLMPPQQNAALLEQGHAIGAFPRESVIMTTSRGSEGILNYFSPGTDVSAIMKGFFSIKFWPNYYIGRSNAWDEFAHRWRQQPVTTGHIAGGGTRVCDNSTDDDGNYYLYRSQNNVSHCLGLNFSSYDVAGTTISPYVAGTYDATALLAKALHFAVENNLNVHDASVIESILVFNVTLVGVTGLIDIYEGLSEYGHDGRGNRYSGLQYYLLNFNEGQYLQGRDPMVIAGAWEGDTEIVYDCNSGIIPISDCFHPEFSDKDGKSIYVAPDDSPPTKYILINFAESAVLFVMSGLNILLVLLFMAMVMLHTKEKIIKASQPILLYCILLGGLMAAIRILLAGLHRSDMICASEFWLGHLSFVTMIGSLFVKAWRVQCLVNSKTIRRVTFTAWRAARMLAMIVSTMLILLIISHFMGMPRQGYRHHESHNQLTKESYCTLTHTSYEYGLFAIEFISMIFVFRTCWEIRNVPDVVNESKSISAAVASVMALCCFILPIVYLLGLDPSTRELIASLGFAFGSLIVLLMLFLPKWFQLVANNKVVDSAEGNASTKANNYVDALVSGMAFGSQSCIGANELFRRKGAGERVTICQEQIANWQAELLKQQEIVLHSSFASNSQSFQLPTKDDGAIIMHDNIDAINGAMEEPEHIHNTGTELDYQRQHEVPGQCSLPEVNGSIEKYRDERAGNWVVVDEA